MIGPGGRSDKPPSSGFELRQSDSRSAPAQVDRSAIDVCAYHGECTSSADPATGAFAAPLPHLDPDCPAIVTAWNLTRSEALAEAQRAYCAGGSGGLPPTRRWTTWSGGPGAARRHCWRRVAEPTGLRRPRRALLSARRPIIGRRPAAPRLRPGARSASRAGDPGLPRDPPARPDNVTAMRRLRRGPAVTERQAAAPGAGRPAHPRPGRRGDRRDAPRGRSTTTTRIPRWRSRPSSGSSSSIRSCARCPPRASSSGTN